MRYLPNKYLPLFWLGLGLLLLSACNSSTAPVTSRELSVYSFAEYIPAEVVAGFEQSTGVKVTVSTYANNEELLAHLTANPGQYDLIIPTDYAIETLIDQKAIQALDLARIPNYSNINHAFLSPYFDPGGIVSKRPGGKKEKFSLPYLWGTTGIAYDSSKVTEPISAWADLWRSDLKGHIVVLNDGREMIGLTLLSLGYDKNSTNPAQLALARDKLHELSSAIIAYESGEPETYLLSGEAWVAVLFNGNAALAARENPQITYVLPTEGAGIWFDNLAIPTMAPHPDAAYTFINYLLAPENAAIIMQQFPYSTPNQAALEFLAKNKADFYQAYISNTISNPPQDVLNDLKLVKQVTPAATALYDQYWTEVVKK